jgi:glycosyltransferase involved in cell wall biosynthesis
MNNHMRNKSILLVAYQCGPAMGSVSQIGWEWFVRLRAEHEVCLVTHVRNRIPLEDAGIDDAILYIDTEWFAGPLYRLAKRLFPQSEHSVFLISSLDYFLFDFIAYLQLRRAVKVGVLWKLIHRVTPVTLAAPTWLGRLGIPLLVGPLNSGLGSPKGFDAILQKESVWLIHLRKLGRVFDTLIGSSRRISRMLIATTTTFEAVEPRYRLRCRMMPENGVNLEHFSASAWPPPPTKKRPLKIIFVGRLIPLKGLDMLLEAIANMRLQGKNVQLDVIGDGPMNEPWQALTRQLGIDDIVRFSGTQPNEEVAQRIISSHVLCLPSVRESGGAVLLEAMSCARPVIALAFGGPAEIISDDCGVLVEMISPEQVVTALSESLSDIIVDSATWARRGASGRKIIEQKYSWPAKIATIKTHYLELIREGINHV